MFVPGTESFLVFNFVKKRFHGRMVPVMYFVCFELLALALGAAFGLLMGAITTASVWYMLRVFLTVFALLGLLDAAACWILWIRKEYAALDAECKG